LNQLLRSNELMDTFSVSFEQFGEHTWLGGSIVRGWVACGWRFGNSFHQLVRDEHAAKLLTWFAHTTFIGDSPILRIPHLYFRKL
jgi:hypothetical protein